MPCPPGFQDITPTGNASYKVAADCGGLTVNTRFCKNVSMFVSIFDSGTVLAIQDANNKSNCSSAAAAAVMDTEHFRYQEVRQQLAAGVRNYLEQLPDLPKPHEVQPQSAVCNERHAWPARQGKTSPCVDISKWHAPADHVDMMNAASNRLIELLEAAFNREPIPQDAEEWAEIRKMGVGHARGMGYSHWKQGVTQSARYNCAAKTSEARRRKKKEKEKSPEYKNCGPGSQDLCGCRYAEWQGLAVRRRSATGWGEYITLGNQSYGNAAAVKKAMQNCCFQVGRKGLN